MKKLTILGIVAVLVALVLSACGTQPPAATPTATVAPEVLASKARDVIGVWLGIFEGLKRHLEFMKEGTFRRVEVSGGTKTDEGEFWFAGTQLKLESAGGRCETMQGEVITCLAPTRCSNKTGRQARQAEICLG